MAFKIYSKHGYCWHIPLENQWVLTDYGQGIVQLQYLADVQDPRLWSRCFGLLFEASIECGGPLVYNLPQLYLYLPKLVVTLFITYASKLTWG